MEDENAAVEHLVREASIVEIRQDFNYLTELLAFGELSGDEYREKLEGFAWFDEEGRRWMISPENGNWYRFAEGKVVLGEPPSVLYSPVEEPRTEPEAAAAGFCSGCGNPLKADARFCRKCGQRV